MVGLPPPQTRCSYDYFFACDAAIRYRRYPPSGSVVGRAVGVVVEAAWTRRGVAFCSRGVTGGREGIQLGWAEEGQPGWLQNASERSGGSYPHDEARTELETPTFMLLICAHCFCALCTYEHFFSFNVLFFFGVLLSCVRVPSSLRVIRVSCLSSLSGLVPFFSCFCSVRSVC